MTEKSYTTRDLAALSSSSEGGYTRIVRRIPTSGDSNKLSYSNRRSNYDTNFFFELQNAISKMTELPDGHYMHLDSKLSHRAKAILSVIASNSKIGPPRLINENGDAVVFTWKRPRGKSYLSVDCDHIDLMEFEDPNKQRVVQLGDDEEIDLAALLAQLQDSISTEV